VLLLLLLPLLLLANQLAGCSCTHLECLIIALLFCPLSLNNVCAAAPGAGFAVLPPAFLINIC
jgi:hypothetical protein